MKKTFGFGGRGWFLLVLAGLALSGGSRAGADDSDSISGFRQPRKEIVELLTTPEPPEILFHRASSTAAMLTLERVVPWERMSSSRFGLAGFRYDPLRGVSGVDARVKQIELVRTDGESGQIPQRWQAPANACWDWVQFSPDGRYLSAVQTGNVGPPRLVLIDIQKNEVKLLPTGINAAWGNPCQWTAGGRLLCRVVRRNRGEAPASVPGPVVLEHKGPPLPTRTYPNRLSDENSVRLFEHYFASELAWVSVDGATEYPGVEAGLISSFKASPEGHFILLNRLMPPYSKLVRASGFPHQVEVWDVAGRKRLYRSATIGLDSIPEDEAPAGDPVSLAWAPESPTVAGFIRKRRDERDAVVYDWRTLKAPFSTGADAAVTLATSDHPIREFGWTSEGTPWFITGTDKRGEIAVFAVSDGGARRVWQGVRGSDDSSSAIRVNGGQGAVLESDGEIFLVNEGLGDKEPRSSLTATHIQSGKQRPLFTSMPGVYEAILAVLDDKGEVLLTRREGASLPPELMRIEKGRETSLFRAPEPYPQLRDVTRQRIQYTRKDGVPLSALLYLPKRNGPEAETSVPLPTLIWIYPHELYDPAMAGLLDTRHFQHHRIKGPSPVAAVLAGYAVIQYPSIPVIHDREESEDYLPELVASSDALVDYLVENRISDPERIAIGGHSFGAFSSANLLIHSDRFATAIAMSGAYNRTLTPFGFQHEKRTFWEAREYYADISPFYHADRFRKPILLIHGGEDPNPGTPVMQTRRFFHALVGEGVTARLVELPNEEHQYSGRETLLHASWEMIHWLDTHLK